MSEYAGFKGVFDESCCYKEADGLVKTLIHGMSKRISQNGMCGSDTGGDTFDILQF
jgi:hypothetical protein